MRDRLFELLCSKSCWHNECKEVSCAECGNIGICAGDAERIADHLLENGVIVPPYKPFPVVLSEDENNSDVFCPFCNTDLSGHYYGGDYEPPKIVSCFGCGTWLDGTKAITKEEAQALKGGGEG